ncbi:MAG TPA: glycosyltransferase family 39 protein, partial [Candidatus Polarisedimenticolia bacterium]|nr:glycosyltransferase family 39 protein [Candidatus Polarisedimenticolia bacterium]
MKARRLDIVGIFAGAYLIRLIYLVQISKTPLFDFLHLDPRYYHDWAARIAAGDWLGTQVFEQSPLYPYLLAIYMLAFGDDLWTLRLIQIAVGAVSCVLTYLLGRRLFDRRAGLLAAAGCALYGPFLFYEGQVMKEFLTPPLATLALLLLLKGSEGRARLLAAAGASIAAAALVRDNFLLLVPIFGAWLLVTSGFRLAPALAFAAGALALLLPLAVRNAVVGGEFVLTTAGGGEVFYIGNGPYANGAYVPPPWVRSNPRYEHEDFRVKAREMTGRPLTRGESSRFWWRQGATWIAEHPGAACRLWLRKLALFWNDHELPDNYSFYTFRRFSSLLALLLTFGPVAVLAAAGGVLTLDRRREMVPLYLAGAGYMFSVLLFFNFARFRLPIVPILLVLAGHALTAFWDAGRG